MSSFPDPETFSAAFPTLRSRIVHCCHHRLTPCFFLSRPTGLVDLCFATRPVHFRFAHLRDIFFLEGLKFLPSRSSRSSRFPYLLIVRNGGPSRLVASTLSFQSCFFFFFSSSSSFITFLRRGEFVRSFPLFIGPGPDRPSWPGSAPGSARSAAA